MEKIEDITSCIHFMTPPENQGQIVTVSYAVGFDTMFGSQYIWVRRVNAGTGSVTYTRAAVDALHDWYNDEDGEGDGFRFEPWSRDPGLEPSLFTEYVPVAASRKCSL